MGKAKKGGKKEADKADKEDDGEQGEKKEKKSGEAGACKKCCSKIKNALRAKTGRGVVLFYAAYVFVHAAGAVTLLCFYRSLVDVGWGKYNQRMIWWMCWGFVLPFSLLGIVGALKRHRKLTRIWCFSMPLLLLMNIGNTVTMYRLQCHCDTYRQCSAIKDFAPEPYTIPIPAPVNIPKFAHLATFPWKDPPAEKKASLVQTEGEAQSYVHLNTRNPLASRPTGRVMKILKTSPVIPTLEETSTISSSTTSPSPVELQVTVRPTEVFVRPHDSSCTEVEPKQQDEKNVSNGSGISSWMEREKGTSVSNASLWMERQGPEEKSAAQDSLFDGHHARVTVTRSDRRHASIRKHGNSLESDPMDMRRLYRMNVPLKKLYMSKAANENIGAVTARNCTDSKVTKEKRTEDQEITDFKAETLGCRRDRSMSTTLKCPAQVEDVLKDCVHHETCGAVRIEISEIPPKEKWQGKKRKWKMAVCSLELPVEAAKGETILDADDNDAAWDKADPLIVIFTRDMTKKLSETGQMTFGQMIEPAKQSKMNLDQWLNYMTELKHSGCHCHSLSRSCLAYEEGDRTGILKYWCRIDGDDKEGCLKKRLPGGNPLKIQLFKMPTGNQLWTRDLCTEQDTPADELPKPKCDCMEGTGFKVTGPERSKVNKQIVRAASNKMEILVGYKCDKWFTEDTNDWCVVGFDSACADKEEQIISQGQKLRVWKSSIPCEKTEYPRIIEKASGHCRLAVIVWWTFDIPRYLLFPIMFGFVWQWLKVGCQDGSGGARDQRGFVPMEDDDDAVAGILPEDDPPDSNISSSSYESYSDPSPASYSEEEDDKKKKGKKGKK